MCGRSFLISSRSDSYLLLWIYGQNSTDSWRTTRYDDSQSPRNKASKIQKLAFRCFLLTSAKAKKFQDGDRSIRLYTTISLQLRRFSKIATIVYQKDSRSFQQWVQREAKRSILQDYELTDTHTHTTHTQTDCYNPPPTLGLIIKGFLNVMNGCGLNDRTSIYKKTLIFILKQSDMPAVQFSNSCFQWISFQALR